MQHPARCSQLWLAVWVAAWLMTLPLRLRHHSFPDLLERLTSQSRRRPRLDFQEIEHVVRAVVWVSHWRLFRLPCFPRVCLRRALALYYTLSRLGYAVTIHFGVRKEEHLLQGHSWVTVQGIPVAEDAAGEVFHVVYSYPPGRSRAAHRETGGLQGDAAIEQRRLSWNR